MYPPGPRTCSPLGDEYTPTEDITIRGHYEPLTISLADDASNEETLYTHNGKRAQSVTLSGRTLYKDNDWNTLCLPFDVTIAGSALAGATIKELDVVGKYDGSGNLDNENGTYQTSFGSDGTLYLYFKDATNIEAGKPYLIKWASGTDISAPSFTGVTISNDMPEVNSADKKVQFKGSYSPATFTGEDKSKLYLGSGNNLYWPSENKTLGSCRAYFTIDLGDESDGGELLVREVRLNLDGGEVAEIQSVSGKRLAVSETGAWFDLFGLKLNGKPSVPGIYYNKCKKIVIE